MKYKVKLDDFFRNGNNRKNFKAVIEQNPEIVNSGHVFIIKIPARRYDNKFLGFEKDLITEYMLWNHCKRKQNNSPNRTYNHKW